MVPKDTLLPRCARPRLRPLNCLRNLVRLGCNISRYPLATAAALFRRAIASLFFLLNLVHTTQYFTAEDPNFDADGAVRGFRTNRGIINICTQGVQRHAAFTVPFGTRDLGTTKATGKLHLDTFSTSLQCVLYRALHRATEHHASLDLARDVVCNQARINIRLAHFLDVDVHRHTHLLCDFATQALDILALLANHDARTCCADGDTHVLARTLDLDAANRSVLQTLEQV